jgi:hypothetical protein
MVNLILDQVDDECSRGEREAHHYDFFHVAIDDATKRAYVEVLPDERRQSTTGFLIRALRWFRARGIRVERVMTDNGSGYVAKLFRKALRILGSVTSAQGPTRPEPTARPSASSRPSCENGPTPSPTAHPTAEPPTCRDGSPGITISDLMLASADEHRLRP